MKTEYTAFQVLSKMKKRRFQNMRKPHYLHIKGIPGIFRGSVVDANELRFGHFLTKYDIANDLNISSRTASRMLNHKGTQRHWIFHRMKVHRIKITPHNNYIGHTIKREGNLVTTNNFVLGLKKPEYIVGYHTYRHFILYHYSPSPKIRKINNMGSKLHVFLEMNFKCTRGIQQFWKPINHLQMEMFNIKYRLDNALNEDSHKNIVKMSNEQAILIDNAISKIMCECRRIIHFRIKKKVFYLNRKYPPARTPSKIINGYKEKSNIPFLNNIFIMNKKVEQFHKKIQKLSIMYGNGKTGKLINKAKRYFILSYHPKNNMDIDNRIKCHKKARDIINIIRQKSHQS